MLHNKKNSKKVQSDIFILINSPKLDISHLHLVNWQIQYVLTIEDQIQQILTVKKVILETDEKKYLNTCSMLLFLF